MYQTFLLILLVALQIPVVAGVGYILVLMHKKPKSSAVAALAPALAAPVVAAPIPLAAPMDSSHTECKVCHRIVARYNADGVCANCAPAK